MTPVSLPGVIGRSSDTRTGTHLRHRTHRRPVAATARPDPLAAHVIRLDGDAVRLARLDLGLSQRALARAVGLSNTAFITIENADPNLGSELTLAHLQRLVDTLGVPLQALFTDDTPQLPADHRAHAPEHGPRRHGGARRAAAPHLRQHPEAGARGRTRLDPRPAPARGGRLRPPPPAPRDARPHPARRLPPAPPRRLQGPDPRPGRPAHPPPAPA